MNEKCIELQRPIIEKNQALRLTAIFIIIPVLYFLFDLIYMNPKVFWFPFWWDKYDYYVPISIDGFLIFILYNFLAIAYNITMISVAGKRLYLIFAISHFLFILFWFHSLFWGLIKVKF